MVRGFTKYSRVKVLILVYLATLSQAWTIDDLEEVQQLQVFKPTSTDPNKECKTLRRDVLLSVKSENNDIYGFAAAYESLPQGFDDTDQKGETMLSGVYDFGYLYLQATVLQTKLQSLSWKVTRVAFLQLDFKAVTVGNYEDFTFSNAKCKPDSVTVGGLLAKIKRQSQIIAAGSVREELTCVLIKLISKNLWDMISEKDTKLFFKNTEVGYKILSFTIHSAEQPFFIFKLEDDPSPPKSSKK